MLKRLFLSSVLSLAFLFQTAAAEADTVLTLRNHHDAFEVMGEKQEAKDTPVKIWLGADRMRRDEGDASMILRLDRKKLYVLDHTDKTYSEIALPVDFRKLMPGQEELAKQIEKMMEVDAQVTPTQESQKIGQWNARKVQVTLKSAMGMTISSNLWISTDVAGYKALNQMSSTLLALQPGTAKWAQKLASLEGFPVLQEQDVSAVGARFKIREELLSSQEQAAPGGTYDLPGGYKAKPFDPLAASRR
jgi:hypothetical protein